MSNLEENIMMKNIVVAKSILLKKEKQTHEILLQARHRSSKTMHPQLQHLLDFYATHLITTQSLVELQRAHDI
jgi:hypothetical protein